MDTINHCTTGFLTTAIPCTLLGLPMPWIIGIGIAGAIIGGLPDILGELYAHIKKDNYIMYNRLHSGDISKIFKSMLIYPYIIHISLDKVCHGAGERWYAGVWYEYLMPWKWREMMWLEMFMWLINLFLIYLFIYLIK